jgi:phenylacetate-CoA ligase
MNLLTERAIYFYSFDATSEKMLRFLQALIKHRPEVILAYPNMLTALAEFARLREVPLPRVPSLVTTAEPLYAFQRPVLEDSFTGRVYERYGSRELGTMAADFPSRRGLNLFEPAYYFEVVDNEGKPVDSGEMGELVVTDFYNYAMPLIRYRTGDMVRLHDPGRVDGCSWKQLSSVGGRVVDLLVRPDGSQIAGQALIMLLRTSGVRCKVQVVQTEPDRLQVKHLRRDTIADDVRRRLQAAADELFRCSTSIEYQPVEKLEHDKSGKYRYVTSECS